MDTVVNWFVDLNEESQAVHNAKNRNKNAKENPSFTIRENHQAGRQVFATNMEEVKMEGRKKICHKHLPVFL